MEGSISHSEGNSGGQQDAELILKEKDSASGTNPLTLTEDWQFKARDYQLRVSKAKIENYAHIDMLTNCATGVDEENEKSFEELVFLNHLLLREIFKHSTFKDLKSHRKLNRLWNLEATKAILSRFSLKPISLSSWGAVSPGEFRTFMSLEKFHLFLKQSEVFPCNSLLVTEAHLTEDMLLMFLKHHGSLIRSLVLGWDACDAVHRLEVGDEVKINRNMTAEEFIQLLADSLPNLEVLILRSFSSSSQIEPSSHGELAKELKKLHTLEIHCDLSKEFLSLFLNRSKNLKHIYLMNSKCLQILIELDAIRLLKNIFFTFDFVGDSISLYKQVVKQQLSCKEINVEWGTAQSPEVSEADLPKVGHILSEAFQKCSGSLRNLFLPLPVGHLHELRFATCPKVTRLVTNYRNPEQPPFNLPFHIPPFPSDFNLGMAFPNLREFELLFDYFKFGDLLLFSETSIPVLSLRVLKVHGPNRTRLFAIPTGWVEQFCQLFPNITTASFGPVYDSGFGLISNFRFLEKLEVTIVVEDMNIDFVRVDALLTGLPQEDVRRIYESRGCGKYRENLVYLPWANNCVSIPTLTSDPVRASIPYLQNLTELVIQIFFLDRYSDRRKEDVVVGSGRNVNNPVLKMGPNVTISHVSRKFCFDMCSKLGSNVIIKYNMNSFRMPRT